jgi:beta-N-acetylhexosaminidase
MISAQLMLAFNGYELDGAVAERLRTRPPAGVSLFRHHNVRSAEQVRALTTALQAAAPASSRPLLIAADQETGQLCGLGDEMTPFAGAMALGAAGDEQLAEEVARAIAREMRALGVNVDYVPVCDLATNPDNPALGIRSFGDDPEAVGRLVSATVRGLQAEGVAATAKHFPGNGEGAVDTHHELAVVHADRSALDGRELVPFRAALAAGARLVMSGHFALPAVTGDEHLPGSLSGDVVGGLLRRDLGFEGLAITDALDMHAIAQGAAQVVDVICAVRAGEDLLLATPDAELVTRLDDGLAQAERRGLIDRAAGRASLERVAQLRAWLAQAGAQPELSVVGCPEHRALAARLAARSVTLVRNDEGLLPLRPADGARIAVVQPRPVDLTPADTSSYVAPMLAETLRRHHRAVDSFVVDPLALPENDLLARLSGFDLIVLGTVSANLLPDQARLAHAVLALGRPTVTVALRTPWDLLAYPKARTHVCSYSILGPSLDALVDALFGEQPFCGHLPVTLGDLHPRGHGLAA